MWKECSQISVPILLLAGICRIEETIQAGNYVCSLLLLFLEYSFLLPSFLPPLPLFHPSSSSVSISSSLPFPPSPPSPPPPPLVI